MILESINIPILNEVEKYLFNELNLIFQSSLTQRKKER